MDEDVPAPAMFGGLAGIPDLLFRALYGLDEFDGVAPRELGATTCCTIPRSGNASANVLRVF